MIGTEASPCSTTAYEPHGTATATAGNIPRGIGTLWAPSRARGLGRKRGDQMTGRTAWPFDDGEGNLAALGLLPQKVGDEIAMAPAVVVPGRTRARAEEDDATLSRVILDNQLEQTGDVGFVVKAHLSMIEDSLVSEAAHPPIPRRTESLLECVTAKSDRTYLPTDAGIDENGWLVPALLHAYFLGANDPYSALKTTLKAEIDPEAWASLHSDTSRPFQRPTKGRIAVKVINHLGDEVMKVFKV